MNKQELLSVLNELGEEIDFSIDISTGQHDAFRRIFSVELLGYIQNENMVLLSGELNDEKITLEQVRKQFESHIRIKTNIHWDNTLKSYVYKELNERWVNYLQGLKDFNIL
jgi:hypothetical protein